MLDQAGYKSENHNAFVNLQFRPSARAEIFATTFYNKGTAAIDGFVYDSSNIVPVQAAGLDFALMSRTFSDFSRLDLRNLTQTIGMNYRVSNAVVVNTLFAVGDFNDAAPYLYDSTGRRVSFMAGVNWIF